MSKKEISDWDTLAKGLCFLRLEISSDIVDYLEKLFSNLRESHKDLEGYKEAFLQLKEVIEENARSASQFPPSY